MAPRTGWGFWGDSVGLGKAKALLGTLGLSGFATQHHLWGASEEEYSEFNVKWCNKEVRHEQKVMKHFQRDLRTWDRGQSRAVVSSETLSTTQSQGCCPPLHGLTPNSPNPALHSPRHFWVKNKGTQGG